MEQPDAYHPIACDFHDRLEALATLRRRVRLSLYTGSAMAEGIIADIYTVPDKREFLRLDNGAEIRLDFIADVAAVD